MRLIETSLLLLGLMSPLNNPKLQLGLAGIDATLRHNHL